jgi:hypothetical protein
MVGRFIKEDLHDKRVGLLISELLRLIHSAEAVGVTGKSESVSYSSKGINTKRNISKETLVGGIERNLVATDDLARVGQNKEENILTLGFGQDGRVSIYHSERVIAR